MKPLRTYILLMILCLSSALWSGQAQEFITLSAKDFPMGATLPQVKKQFQLPTTATHFQGCKLLYPECIPLTKEEQKWVTYHQLPPIAMPEIHFYTKTSRQQTWVDLSFTPIVFRDGKWQRIISCLLQPQMSLSAQSAIRTLSDKSHRYAAHSVLAKGKWHKISVTEEGIYQLNATQLKKMGFEHLERVKIYGYGGRQLPENFSLTGPNRLADDLEEVATYLTDDHRLLFFAEGTRRTTWDAAKKLWRHQNNTYSLKSYYFLTEGDRPLRIATATHTDRTAEHIQKVIVPAIYDKEKFSWFEGGRVFFDDYDFYNGNTNSFQLSTPHLSTGSTATIAIDFSAASTLAKTEVAVKVNDHHLGNFSISAYESEKESAREVTKIFTTQQLQEKNTFSFTTTAHHHAHLGYITASYLRQLTAEPFVFSPVTVVNAGVFADIQGATAHSAVWKIQQTGQPTSSMAREGDHAFYLDDPQQRYIYVDLAATYSSPQTEGEIPQQDLHADPQADMVVILPAANTLVKEAERLVKAHRDRGLRVNIVRAPQLYNEFSSGTPDPTAYRRYLKMLYDRAQTATDLPKYLLLFGACNWDNRFIIDRPRKNYNPEELLLAYEVSANDNYGYYSIGTVSSFVTDDYYGLLDDGEGKNLYREAIDLSIGRLLCTTAEEAKILVDKTLNYMAQKEVGAWKNHLIFMGDNGDENLHMTDADSVANPIARLHPDLNVEKVYWDAYPSTKTATGVTYPQVTQLLRQMMQKGALMFNYTGHGSPTMISHTKVLTMPDFELSSQNRLPLWIFSSCEVTPYDRRQDDIGRTALYNPTGGAIAVMAASRAVYSSYNRQLNRFYCEHLFAKNQEGQLPTMADALRLAKCKLIDTQDDRSNNKLKYTFLGDPSIPIAMPLGNMGIDSINGVALTPESDLQLSAGQKVRFSGYIGKEKSISTAFNGVVTGSLYDANRTITCYNYGNVYANPKKMEVAGKKLFEGLDSVKNGRFTLHMMIPRDISYSDLKGMLRLYAVNNAHQMECHGRNTAFHLNGTVTHTKIDSIGPKVFVYLNQPDFPNGGIVGENAQFGAHIIDSLGINAIGGGIGHDITLTIDDNPHQTYILNNYFNYDFGQVISGTVQYPLTALTPGQHQLKLRVFDINNNSTTATLDFVVDPKYQPDYQLHLTQNPVRHATTFIASIPTNEGTYEGQIEIFAIDGTRIWEGSCSSSAHQNFLTLPWEACTQNGQPCNNGIYLARLTIKNNGKTIKHLTEKIIINR